MYFSIIGFVFIAEPFWYAESANVTSVDVWRLYKVILFISDRTFIELDTFPRFLSDNWIPQRSVVSRQWSYDLWMGPAK